MVSMCKLYTQRTESGDVLKISMEGYTGVNGVDGKEKSAFLKKKQKKEKCTWRRQFADRFSSDN